MAEPHFRGLINSRTGEKKPLEVQQRETQSTAPRAGQPCGPAQAGKGGLTYRCPPKRATGGTRLNTSQWCPLCVNMAKLIPGLAKNGVSAKKKKKKKKKKLLTSSTQAGEASLE